MGILDGITTTFNKGTAAAERSAKSVKIKSQINEVNKRRQQLAAQLGASLYEVTKDNADLRAGREQLYDAIAACDAERDGYQAQLDVIEREAAAAATAARSFNCQKCGTTVSEADLFCSGCGTPVDQARPQVQVAAAPAVAPAAAGPTCASCGAPMNPGDAFCMGCGAKVEAAPEAAPAAAGPTCASCGAPVNPGDAFCMGCGAKVDAASEPAAPADTADAASAEAAAAPAASADAAAAEASKDKNEA